MLPEAEAIRRVFGFSDDRAGVVGAGDGAAYLVEVIGLRGFNFVHLVEKAETVNVVGLGGVGVVANEEAAETAVWINHVSDGSIGIGESAPPAFRIIGVSEAVCVGELVARVIDKAEVARVLADWAKSHVTIIIVGDGLAIYRGEAIVVVIGASECGMLPTAMNEGGAEAGFDLTCGVILEGYIGDEFAC